MSAGAQGSPVAQSFAQKVLARASGRKRVEVGEIVEARPERLLSHDNTAAIAEIWRRFEQPRLPRPERLAITLDHAVPAPTARHARNHAEIRCFVAEQSIPHFFEVGRGICHQVLSEEGLVLPGQLVLGADSHTPHFGWLGAFGSGVGRSEMAVLWATGELWLRVPETVRIEVEGRLGRWVSAKDLALDLLGTLGAAGGLYRSIELAGEAVVALGTDGRATLVNMMAEMGAKCAYVAPDETVYAYLEARGVERGRLEDSALFPDPGAPYLERHRFDASSLEPQVACPHAPDRTTPVSRLEAVAVDQAFVGTCTNGRLEDLEVVHRILAGRRLAGGTRLLVVPASSQVLEEACRRGWIAELIAAGAAVGTPGCGPCMGNHLGVPAAGEVCISSGNRNFKGRMGEPEAEIYLASPAVVAASAVAGRIAHPEEISS